MDKNAIKKYAVWARRELIARVSQKALQYGITEKDCGDPNADSVNGTLLSNAEKKQRKALISQINEKATSRLWRKLPILGSTVFLLCVLWRSMVTFLLMYVFLLMRVIISNHRLLQKQFIWSLMD